MSKTITTALGLLALGGCTAPPAFFNGLETLRIDGALIASAQGDMATGPSNPTVGVYVQSEYWLDYEAPTTAQLEAIQPPGADLATVEPWIRRGDINISVPWTLTNDTDQVIRNVFVTLDGANEWFDYNPIATFGANGGEDAEEPQFPSLLGFTPMELEPGEVRRGEFREDDFEEAMYDLDVMTRFCGGPFALIYNRHERDPVGTEQLPGDAVLAGMVLLRLTVAASAPVSLDYAIRVRDEGGILFDSARDNFRYEVMPEIFVPGGGAAGMGMDPGMMPMGCTVGGG